MIRVRRSPYPLGTAMADVVERLIQSHATQIDVALEFAGDDSWIRISCDGRALRDGDLSSPRSDEDPSNASGLARRDVVSACLAHGRVVSVASRSESGEPSLIRWEARGSTRSPSRETLPAAVALDALIEPLAAGARTVVVVQQLEAVMAFRHRSGLRTERHLRSLSEALGSHLRQVFHRHLAGSARRAALTVTVGGTLLEPSLPFPEKGWRATALRRRSLPFVHATDAYEVTVVPHLVEPVREPFATVPARPAGRPSKSGFYVYCADRLIQNGGWNNLHRPGSRGSVLAIVVDVPAAAGAAFVRRAGPTMRVRLPPSLIPGLKAVVLGSLSEPGPHRAA